MDSNTVRLDDYPTGVRPIIHNHIQEFDRILSRFEHYEVPYLLAVVPTLVTEDDLEYLKTLKWAEIALHGYNHNFFTWNGTNNHEFLDMDQEQIDMKLAHGLSILSDFTITCFVAPFNNYTQPLLSSLLHFGLTQVTVGPETERYLDFSGFEVFKPKFYGRLREWRSSIGFEDIALHLTWEHDNVNEPCLENFLNAYYNSMPRG